MLSWYLLFQYWIGSNEGIDAANQNAGIDGHPANGLAGFIPPKIIASHRNAHVQNINEKLHEMPMSSQLTGLPGENSSINALCQSEQWAKPESQSETEFQALF